MKLQNREIADIEKDIEQGIEEQAIKNSVPNLSLWGHLWQVAKGTALLGASVACYFAASHWIGRKDENLEQGSESVTLVEEPGLLITPGAGRLASLSLPSKTENLISGDKFTTPNAIPDESLDLTEPLNIPYRTKPVIHDEPLLAMELSDSRLHSRRIQSTSYAYQPIGSEFKANTYTIGDQGHAVIKGLSNGNFVMLWHSNDQDGSSSGVYSQRYDANGIPLGSEFRINTYTLNAQSEHTIAALPNGGFVVSWSSRGQDGTGLSIYAKRYDADAVPLGSEFRVNTYATGDQIAPMLAAQTNGNFIITWSSSGQDGSGYGVYAQRYDVNEGVLGSEFRVNTYTTGDQGVPFIATLANDNFVIIWQSFGQDGSGYGIYAQRYDANGIPLGSEFRANTYTPSDQEGLNIASLTNGGFVITWDSNGQDGSGIGVYAQRYDVNGTPVDSEFKVNTYTLYRHPMILNNSYASSLVVRVMSSSHKRRAFRRHRQSRCRPPAPNDLMRWKPGLSKTAGRSITSANRKKALCVR